MRQFVLEKQSVKNGLIILDGKDFRYIHNVLRAKVGDMVCVRLQNGTLENTTVARIDEKARKLTLQICSTQVTAGQIFTGDLQSSGSITRGVQTAQSEQTLSSVEYWLFQFVPKPVKMEQIVRQAVECGISVIVPVIGEYSQKSSITAIEGSKKERFERIIKEARQQSGSPIDTKVLSPMTLAEAVKLWNENLQDCNETDRNLSNLALVLSERSDCKKTFKEIIADSCSVKKVCIAVGSEGGISPEEICYLEEKGMFQAVHFAVNILRCETAALYGIAAVQAAIG